MSNIKFPYYPFDYRLQKETKLPAPNFPATWFYWSDGDYFLDNPTIKPTVNPTSTLKEQKDGWKLNEEKTKYTIEFECPGSTKDDVTVELKDFTLSLAAKYKNVTKTKTVEIPYDADEKYVEVFVKNGILKIEVKVHEDTKPKSIPIK